MQIQKHLVNFVVTLTRCVPLSINNFLTLIRKCDLYHNATKQDVINRRHVFFAREYANSLSLVIFRCSKLLKYLIYRITCNANVNVYLEFNFPV